MVKLNILELKEEMIIAKPIMCLDTNKLLLNYGEVLTKPKINILKNRKIQEVFVLDKYTAHISLVDIIKEELIRKLNLLILQLAPQEVQASESHEMIQVSLLAQEMVLGIVENETILDFCTEMKLVDNIFLYEQSISTCALSLLIAGAMGLEKKEIKKIGSAALLHDVGLIEMPLLLEAKKSKWKSDILYNPGTAHTLASGESMWREHTQYGYYLCHEKGIVDDDIRNIILAHHENWDGTGFPRKLRGEDIPLGSRIIRVCDIYDRLIRGENYPRYQAIEALYAGGGSYLDSNIVEVFTNNLSVYPLGSIVKLTTGEIGVVVNVRKNKGPRPIVKVQYNRVNKPLTYPKEIDLSIDRTIFIKETL